MKKNDKKNADKSIQPKKKSTGQGGSDYGQGSSYLAGKAYQQGAEKNEGANYENEAGKLSKVTPLRKADEGETKPQSSDS